MKKYKLNMTRPEFLMKFLTGADDSHQITEDDLEHIIPGGSRVIYACYSCILESDLDRSQIVYVNFDGKHVMIKLTSKQLAKSVKDACNKDTIRLGTVTYKIHVKQEGAYLYVSVEELDDDFVIV